MKKQLKIWKSDFDRYWDKTSLVGRIVIGAVISLILTYVFTNKFTTPLSKKVKDLHSKMNETAVNSSSSFIIDELRQKLAKSKKRIETLQKSFEEGKDCESSLTTAEVSKVIIAIREALFRSELKVLDEQRLKKKNESEQKRRSSRRKHEPVEDTKIKLNYPDYIDTIGYKMKAYGSFAAIKHFLDDVNSIKHILAINNISLKERPGHSINNRMKFIRAIEIEFEVHVPFLVKGKHSEAKSEKKKKS